MAINCQCGRCERLEEKKNNVENEFYIGLHLMMNFYEAWESDNKKDLKRIEVQVKKYLKKHGLA